MGDTNTRFAAVGEAAVVEIRGIEMGRYSKYTLNGVDMTLDEITAALDVHNDTLYRRAKKHGVSVQDVIDDIAANGYVHDSVKYNLAGKRMPLSNITEKLDCHVNGKKLYGFSHVMYGGIQEWLDSEAADFTETKGAR